MRYCALCRSNAECFNCVKICMLDMKFGRSIKIYDWFSGVYFLFFKLILWFLRGICVVY